MSDKMDRQGVRTPADIERKYNLGQMTSAQGSSAKVYTLVQQLQQNMNTRFDELSASLLKEEQEKSVDITENGTTEVVPDDGKVLSKVTVNVDVAGGGTEELETLIDESGVLDSTEGTVSVMEKVEKLIDKAEDENLWHQYTAQKTTSIGAWNGVAVERLPRMDLTNVSSMSGVFSNMPNLKRVDFYIDTKNCTNFTSLFSGSKLLEYVKGVNTSKATNTTDMFYQCSALKTIEEPIDVSSMGVAIGLFGSCTSLENVRFVEGCIKYTFYIRQSSLLSAESIQSIINGLATVETAQTLNLHSAIVLTDEQKATINAKGWTLAQ